MGSIYCGYFKAVVQGYPEALQRGRAQHRRRDPRQSAGNLRGRLNRVAEPGHDVIANASPPCRLLAAPTSWHAGSS
jgi:hypothetical protein